MLGGAGFSHLIFVVVLCFKQDTTHECSFVLVLLLQPLECQSYDRYIVLCLVIVLLKHFKKISCVFVQ